MLLIEFLDVNISVVEGLVLPVESYVMFDKHKKIFEIKRDVI